jgi:hypothetical protein
MGTRGRLRAFDRDTALRKALRYLLVEPHGQPGWWPR